MEILKKYPKSFQWLFLLIVFFGLCFAIEVPEGYKFIRSIAEYSKDPNLSSYNLFGIEIRYYAYAVVGNILMLCESQLAICEQLIEKLD